MQPRVGHPPSLWKVWAVVTENSSAAAASTIDLVLKNMVSDRLSKSERQDSYQFWTDVQLASSCL